MKKKNEAVYPGAMALLYSVSFLAWNLYVKRWSAFNALSDKYTQQYGEDMLAAVEAAKSMPDVHQRRGNTGNVSNRLQTATAQALLSWKRLERLILKAFPLAEQGTAIVLAGGAHYAKAARGNYSELSLLLAAGTGFISKNMAALQQGGMAASFPTAYNTASATLTQEYASYGAALSTATDDTTDKVKANNALYIALKEMLDDAQTLFEEEPNIRKQFTYKAIRNKVTKDVACGLHFVIRDSETGKGLPAATITFTTQQESYTVNEKGVLDIKLEKGAYKIVVSVPGYVPYMSEVTVDPGVMHRVAITLKKAETGAVAAVA